MPESSNVRAVVTGDDPAHQEVDDWHLHDTQASSERVKRITTAGVLASLSVAIAPIASVLPRLVWGIALFDPTSLLWIIAFLIGGPEVGLVCMGAGAIGLLFYDPTGIGPLFKVLATLPMIVVPWLGLRFFSHDSSGESLSRFTAYLPLMFVAFLLRLVIMVPFNLIMVPLLMPWTITSTEIIAATIILNSVQSIFDVMVPYIVVHPTTLFEHFRMW